jgi:hypothetical protein
MPAGPHRRAQRWRRVVLWTLGFASALSLLVSLLCAWFFYALYLRWDFDELGRHFDQADSVVYTDSASVWGALAAGFLLLALAFLAMALRSRPR